MSERIVMRTGECLIAGGPPFTAAEPEVVIGELDGPVGTAIATLTGNQSAGHSKDPDLDHEALFDSHRRAMAQAIRKAMSNEPSIDWLLENQDTVTHKYYQRALDAKKAKT